MQNFFGLRAPQPKSIRAPVSKMIGLRAPQQKFQGSRAPGTPFGTLMGSIPVGDSDFSLSHARVMLNISYFTRPYLIIILVLLFFVDWFYLLCKYTTGNVISLNFLYLIDIVKLRNFNCKLLYSNRIVI